MLRIEIEGVPENRQERKDLARVLSWCAETDDISKIEEWMYKPVFHGDSYVFSIFCYRGSNHIALHAKTWALTAARGIRFAIITNVRSGMEDGK